MYTQDFINSEPLLTFNQNVTSLLAIVRAEREPVAGIKNSDTTLREHNECLNELEENIQQLMSRVVEQEREIAMMGRQIASVLEDSIPVKKAPKIVDASIPMPVVELKPSFNQPMEASAAESSVMNSHNEASCDECGKTFIKLNPNHWYCSSTCRQQSYEKLSFKS